MKLTSLTCKNFKKLSDFTANFTDGLNVISGENAQGKSTLLQAVEAALFGVTVVPGKKENIPTWGQSTFSLTLTFEVNYSVYELTRTKSSAKLIHVGDDENGGVLVANGNTAVTGYIEDLLGLTAKDWNLFVQSKQGETSGVLTFGATALNQKVEEFAGVSLIDEVARKAQERSVACKAQVESYAVSSEELQAAEAELQGATMAAELAHVDLAGARASLEDIESETIPSPPAVSSVELSRLRRAADQARAAYEKAAGEEASAADALVLAESDLASAETPVGTGEIEEVAKAVKAEIGDLKYRLAEQNDTLQGLKLKAKVAEQAQAEYEACRPVDASEVAEAEESLEGARSEVETQSSWLAEMSARRRSLESLATDAVCPTCGTQLSEHDPEKLRSEIAGVCQEEDKLLDLISGGKQRVIELVRNVADVVKAHNNYVRLKSAAESADSPEPSVVEGVVTAIEGIQGRLEALQATLAEVNAKVGAAEAVATRFQSLQRRVAQAEKRLQQASQERLDAESRLSDGPPDELIELTLWEEAQYEESRLAWQFRHAEAKAAVIAADSEMKAAQVRQNSARHVLDTLQKRAGKARAASAGADQASRLARFLRERRQEYLKEVWDGVLGLASRQVRGATGGLITRVAHDGEFQFEEDGVMAPVYSASGAQKAFIGTALRIGLARALYGRDSLLIFDEPTESMSERNASGLAASLTGAGRQTLLITHREHDQSLAANIITIGA